MPPEDASDGHQHRPRRQASVRLFAAALAAAAIAHGAAFLLMDRTGGVAVLLPANAALLAIIFTRAREGWRLLTVIAAGILGSTAAAMLHHPDIVLAVPVALGNGLEVAIAAMLIRRWDKDRGRFESFRSVSALVVAACVAPLVSATIGGATVAWRDAIAFGPVWARWYCAAALGLALVTPAAVIAIDLVDGRRHEAMAVRRLSEVVGVLGLVALVAAAVFVTPGRPLLFLILPFVLLATFRLRQLGAVAAVTIVAVIAVQATAAGDGPLVAAGAGASADYLFLQFFLAVAFLSALPVAAALAERDARADEAHLIADHFKTVVENAGEVIFRTDLEGRWTYLNPAWETVSGFPLGESLGRPLTAWVEPAERPKLAEWAAPVFAGEVRSTRRMLRFHTASGSVRWMELAIQLLSDQDGQPIGATGTLRDIDDRKRLEEHVLTAKRRAEERARAATLLASTDELTGLANRRAFLRHLDRQTEAATEFGWRLTVAMFDVDHFKRVNDRYGHGVGDRVLRRVAQRASAVCRAGDLIGRLGGEEFGVLMPSAGTEDACQVAERLRQAIETPLPDELDDPTLPNVTVSIGIAARLANQTGAELLAQADSALYAAKEAGRNRVKIAA